jgi:hypothetical protein
MQYASGRAKKYHTGEKKSAFRIFSELYKWQFTESDFNAMYYAMGLNVKGNEQKKIIGRKTFLRLKSDVEKKIKSGAKCDTLNFDVVTKDKFYFTSILSANGIPVVQNYALYCNADLIFPDGKVTSFDALKNLDGEYVIKNNSIEAGEGVLICKQTDKGILINNRLMTEEELIKMLGYSIWVIQKKIDSHQLIKKLNSSALNTTRIVTIQSGKGSEYLTGFQAFVTNNANIDSWSKGSIYAGINPEKEVMKEFGYTSPSDERQGIFLEHPDSKIKFKDYPLPYLADAVRLCINAHRLFYFNFIIGWDVAITDDGPFILEANEKPGMNVVQCVDGGLKEKIIQYAERYEIKV